MKRILFYYDVNWVFGKIHSDLIKTLYPDMYCDIMSWDKPTSQEEMDYLNQKYDFFVSIPERCFELNFRYQIPAQKLVGIIHSDWDIFRALYIRNYDRILFTQLAGYASICPMLINSSISHGINRVPELLRIGLFTDNYKKPKSQTLSNIGYFQVYHRDDWGFDIKRGNLVKHVAELTGLNFCHRNDLSHLAIEKAYSNIDLCMFASLTEGNPYTALESFAAGIPVLGTDTGIFKELSRSGGGITLPFKESTYIGEAIRNIKTMQSNPQLYSDMSDRASEESKKFDWSVVRNDWISYFNSI